MRRRLILCVVGVNVVLVGIWMTVWVLLPKPRINADTIKQIKEGMTEQEVEAIFDAPPGDYREGMTILWYSGPGWGNVAKEVPWLADDAAVSVCFDANGRVLWVKRYGVMRFDEPLRDKLRRWLGF